jgi:uncharacterized protein (PEP-CTERM system associated)
MGPLAHMGIDMRPSGSAKRWANHACIRSGSEGPPLNWYGLCITMGLTWAPWSQAQVPPVSPYLRIEATATDNSGFDDSRQAQGDVILQVSPRLRVDTKGARHRLLADVELNALKYTRHSQPDRILPKGRISLNSEVIERWLFLDSAIDLDQTNENPYAARVDGASSFNRINTTRFSLSPFLQHDFGSEFTLQIRSDNVWTRRGGAYSESDPRRDSVLHQHVVELERRPTPLGFSIELSQQETRYSGDADTVLDIGSARAIANYAVDPQLVLGLSTGAERSRFALSRTTESTYGVRVRWLPTERTDLTLGLDRRFFGTGWGLELRHRAPWIALYLRLTREPTATPTSQVLAPGEGDIAALLNAALTTRHPDAEERARLVRSLIDQLNLPANLTGPLEVFADYAQLQQSASVTMTLLGRVNNVSLTAYSRSYRQLARADDVLGLGAGDNRQRGGVVEVSHRLSSISAIQLSLGASRIEGLGARQGDYTTNRWARAALDYRLSPRSSVNVGLRRQFVRSNVAGSARESGLFAGIAHQF